MSWVTFEYSNFDAVVRVLSGADGSTVLHTLPNPSGGNSFGYQVAALGDLDGDGHADFAVTDLGTLNWHFWTCDRPGRVFVYSGKDAVVLRELSSGLEDCDLFGNTLESAGT